ncbi:multiple sugar transport system permease protein [Kaistia soli DSM 19436]|uniref:Multiple sugar transport system permease protein n=1 Tax=Kaistia soli DSM 19436 TaxID=1122133 RepID=A0A1M5KPL1_9HYPH|nr:sugar ABC transporter permease [Kaistia soli]SHG54123.1 multiple sugar transport system permease protein [Kaistia soli DSM 19436]
MNIDRNVIVGVALPGTVPRMQTLRHWWREAMARQVFLLPIAVVFLALFLIPLGQTLWYSLTDFNGYSRALRFVGIKNYVRAFTDPSMIASLGYTFFYAVSTTIVVTALAIPLAIALNQHFLGRNAVRAVFFFPAIPSIAVLGLVWSFILSPLPSGAVNTVIGLVGLGSVPWLSDPMLARLSTVLVSVWGQTGWHAILYLAYLQSIPSDFYEAAAIDGANARQRFFHLTLPLLAPAVTVSQMLLLTGGLKVFDLPYTLTKGGPGYATTTLSQVIIRRGLGEAKFGEASALAVVFMLLVLAVVVAQFAISRRLERRL